MRKIFFFFLLTLCVQTLFAQRSAFFISENKLFYEGKTMFEDENFSGCIDKLKEFNKTGGDVDLIKESEYLLIVCDYRQGKEGVIDKLKDYLDKNPETIHRDDIYFMIGSSYFKQKDYPNTVLWFNRINIDNLSGKDLENYVDRLAFSYRVIGVTHYEGGNYAEAARYLLPYIRMTEHPSQKDFYLLGVSLFQTQRYNEAIQYLGKSTSMDNAIGQNANMLLGQAYLKTGNKKNALMAFEAASAVNFDMQVKEVAMYNYAILLYTTSTSAFGESVTVLENFLNTFPNSTYADKINELLVENYLTTKNYDIALKSINRIKNPGRKILEAKQKIYYHLGTIDLVNSQYDTAIDYFTQAINLGNYAPTEKALATYWRGEAYSRLDRFDEATKDFQSFRKSDVKSGNLHISALYNLGYVYFNQGNFSTAQTFFSDYINQEKDQSKTTLADAYARLGDCHFESRRFAEAEKTYAKAAALQPSMADYVLYQRGFILGLQADYKGKIEQMDKLIKSFPDSRFVPNALYEKGRAYVMLNDHQSAINVFNLLWNNHQGSRFAGKAGIQIGLLYFNLNELQKSATAYKKVITQYPGSEESQIAIQDLKSVYVDMGDVAGFAQYINSLGGMAKFDVSEQDSLTYLSAEKLFTQGNTTQAQAALKKYIQNFPTGNFINDALIYLANIQYNEKNYSDALDNYQKLSNIAKNRSNAITGLQGVIRSANKLNKYAEMQHAASNLLKESNLSPEIATEAKYYLAKAYIGLNEPGKATTVLKELSKDTRTIQGAEAKYLLAQLYYNSKQYDLAEAEVLDFIKAGTPHAYWLARSFILLSDVYVAKKDYLQARQYLESLKQNYKQNDDIQEMINERLKKLKSI